MQATGPCVPRSTSESKGGVADPRVPEPTRDIRGRLRHRAAFFGTIAMAVIVTQGSALAGPPSPRRGVYGTGIGADTKNNYQVGWTSNAKLSHRFKASTTSQLLSVRFQQRGGAIYSGGNGGTIRVSVQADDGTSAHLPSGTVLASLTLQTGNPSGDWTTYNSYAFPSPATLTAGRIYHLVFENIDPSPQTNWISVNELFQFGTPKPQPAMPSSYAVLYKTSGGWQVKAGDVADMDLAYADGTRDGMGYVATMCERTGVVSGAANRVRQRFTVSGGDRLVRSVSVRVKRISGTGPLTLRLETGSGALVEAVDIPASAVPIAGAGCDNGAATWVTGTFTTDRVLADGATYNLRLSTPDGTQYTADSLLEGYDWGFRSRRFTDGNGQRSTDGGATWQDIYQWSGQDLQFYFK